jgi:hypothetical protein
MGPGVRTLLILLVGAGSFLLALIALGAVGLDRVPYVQTPIALFIAAIALWPLLRASFTSKSRNPFGDWVAYHAALMLSFGLVWYAATMWMSTQVFLESMK